MLIGYDMAFSDHFVLTAIKQLNDELEHHPVLTHEQISARAGVSIATVKRVIHARQRHKIRVERVHGGCKYYLQNTNAG